MTHRDRTVINHRAEQYVTTNLFDLSFLCSLTFKVGANRSWNNVLSQQCAINQATSDGDKYFKELNNTIARLKGYVSPGCGVLL